VKVIAGMRQGNLNHQLIEGIKQEMGLYEGWIKLASLEKKAITQEDFNNLAGILDDAEKHKARIVETESQFSALRNHWKGWSGKDAEAVMPWVERLGCLAEKLASLQNENRKLLENLLTDTRVQIIKLKTGARASGRYLSQGEPLPKFVDIKR